MTNCDGSKFTFDVVNIMAEKHSYWYDGKIDKLVNWSECKAFGWFGVFLIFGLKPYNFSIILK